MEGDGILIVAGSIVELYGVRDGVWVSDGMSVVGIWKPLGFILDLPNTASLVSVLLGGATVRVEKVSHVVQKTEVLASLLSLDNILETVWELMVGPGLAVNLEPYLHHDGLDIINVACIISCGRRHVC